MSALGNNFLAVKGFLLTLTTLLLASCGGGSGAGLDGDGQPNPPEPPEPESAFEEIQDTVFTPICTQCHVGNTAPQGLRLDAANSFDMLVNVASNEVPALLRVDPGNPDDSYLVQKIEGTAAVGGRMPLGQAPLPQDRIDLIRSWIAEGALPASAAPRTLTVSSSVPGRGEVAPAGLDRLTVIFAAEVDASLAASGTFELRDGLDQVIPLAQVRVPAGRPRVVELAPQHPLSAGSYQLTVRGQGPIALADTSGRVLDGDGDGVAGDDHFISFDVGAGAK